MVKNLKNSFQICNNFFLYDKLHRLKDILISLQDYKKMLNWEILF